MRLYYSLSYKLLISDKVITSKLRPSSSSLCPFQITRGLTSETKTAWDRARTSLLEKLVWLKRFHIIPYLGSKLYEGNKNAGPLKRDPPVTFERLLNIIKPERKRLAIGLLATMMSSVSSLAFPSAVGHIIDIVNQADYDLLKVKLYLSGMGLVVLIGSLSTFIRTSQLSLVNEIVSRNLRKEVFTSILLHRTDFFVRNSAGLLVARLANDTVIVATTLTENISRFLKSTFSGIFCSYLLFRISPKLMSFATTILPILALFTVVYGRYRKKATQDLLTALSKETQVSTESFTGIRAIQSFVQEKFAYKRYCTAVNQSFQIARKMALVEGLFLGGGTLTSQATMIYVLFKGSMLLSENIITIGSLTSFCMYTGYLFINVSQLGVSISEFMKAQGASKRVFSLIDSGNALKDLPKKDVLPDDHTPELKFENVHFSFPQSLESEILDGVTFSIRPGEKVAITGQSGCGKSTIASLLLRYYDPTKGKIFYGGKNIEELDISWLRKQIAEVSQVSYLFSGTIAENISLSRSDDNFYSLEDLVKAAQSAKADEFIRKLEKNYFFQVGESGGNLSGGQRQKISIARCLYSTAGLVVCDEPTSALDAREKRTVTNSLLKHLTHRTAFIITHDLNILKAVDRVILLEKGKVIGNAPFSELVKTNEAFSKLSAYFF